MFCGDDSRMGSPGTQKSHPGRGFGTLHECTAKSTGARTSSSSWGWQERGRRWSAGCWLAPSAGRSTTRTISIRVQTSTRCRGARDSPTRIGAPGWPRCGPSSPASSRGAIMVCSPVRRSRSGTVARWRPTTRSRARSDLFFWMCPSRYSTNAWRSASTILRRPNCSRVNCRHWKYRRTRYARTERNPLMRSFDRFARVSISSEFLRRGSKIPHSAQAVGRRPLRVTADDWRGQTLSDGSRSGNRHCGSSTIRSMRRPPKSNTAWNVRRPLNQTSTG